MLKNQIKSVLRNRTNRIYIITFLVLFVILNISINIKAIIDGYYDLEMESYLSKYENKEENLEGYLRREKETRTIYTCTVIELTDEDKKEIMKLKHVQDINIEEIETDFSGKITINYIIVDDWKNSKSIQNYFDNNGIETRVLLEPEELHKTYNIVKSFSNIIKYVVILMFEIILIVCYKNILKNEEKNIKLLSTIGYTRNKIKIIIFVSIITLTITGAILGYGTFKILSYLVIDNILKISIIENMKINLITNAVLVLFPTFIAVGRKI